MLPTSQHSYLHLGPIADNGDEGEAVDKERQQREGAENTRTLLNLLLLANLSFCWYVISKNTDACQ